MAGNPVGEADRGGGEEGEEQTVEGEEGGGAPPQGGNGGGGGEQPLPLLTAIQISGSIPATLMFCEACDCA